MPGIFRVLRAVCKFRKWGRYPISTRNRVASPFPCAISAALSVPLYSRAGNSENQAASANLELKDTSDKWQHTVGFAGNYGHDGNDKTAQRLELRGQTQYEITERAYGFGAARYEDDEFSQYDYQATLSGGLGYKIINTTG